MSEKTYRPKADAEGYALTVNMGGGRVLDVSKFPYSTDDEQEQAVLDAQDALTDRPAPKTTQNKEA